MTFNSAVTLFYQNVNGGRKKLLTFERLFSSYKIVYITEHLRSAYHVSQLELSHDHMFFFRPAELTSGRPSGGPAIAVNEKFSCSLFESSDVYISVNFGSFVLI